MRKQLDLKQEIKELQAAGLSLPLRYLSPENEVYFKALERRRVSNNEDEGNSPAKCPRLTKSPLPTGGEDVEMEVSSNANAVGEDDLAEASLATTTNAVSMRQPMDVLASYSDLPLTPTGVSQVYFGGKMMEYIMERGLI
ncbi:hypothetical protein FRC07_004189, partial [Ceratobasidium sp. 392]